MKEGSITEGLAAIQSNNYVANSGVGSYYQKFDTASIYKGERGRFVVPVSIVLADGGDKNDPYYSVVWPIKILQLLSLPSKNTETGPNPFTFLPPNIFKIYTSHTDEYGNEKKNQLINMRYAALTSINPSYFSPYRNGYPTRCEVNLEFTNLEPLYKDNFGILFDTNKVTTSSSSDGITRRNALNQINQ